MPLDQAHAFRDYVSQNEDVQKEIRSALMTESAKVSEIAAKHGFTFTSEEGQEVWVKLLGFDDRGKVRLSMKVVDQATGEEAKPEEKTDAE